MTIPQIEVDPDLYTLQYPEWFSPPDGEKIGQAMTEGLGLDDSVVSKFKLTFVLGSSEDRIPGIEFSPRTGISYLTLSLRGIKAVSDRNMPPEGSEEWFEAFPDHTPLAIAHAALAESLMAIKSIQNHEAFKMHLRRAALTMVQKTVKPLVKPASIGASAGAGTYLATNRLLLSAATAIGSSILTGKDAISAIRSEPDDETMSSLFQNLDENFVEPLTRDMNPQAFFDTLSGALHFDIR